MSHYLQHFIVDTVEYPCPTFYAYVWQSSIGKDTPDPNQLRFRAL